MAASITLSSILEKHSIFKRISIDDEENEVTKEKAFQLIHIFSGNFFLWDERRSCLLSTNLREAERGGEEKIQVGF